MKNTKISSKAVLAVLCLTSFGVLRAQTNFIKANNATALNTNGSYTIAGAPGTTDTITFNSIYSGASQNVPVGTGGVSISGLVIDASLTGTPIIAASGSSGLTLGAGGITKGGGSALFRISAPITLSANQIWDIGSGGGTLRISGGFNSGGNTLQVTGAGVLELQGNHTFGSEVTITNAQVSVTSGATNVVTLGGANTFDTLSITNGTVSGSTIGDFGVASNFGDGGINTVITFGGTSSIGRLIYTGSTASSNRTFNRNAPNVGNVGLTNGFIEVSAPGQTLTLAGNVTSATSAVNGGWGLGGDGNLIISGTLSDQGNTGVTSVNKFGTGTLTLAGTASYEGVTTINGGTMQFAKLVSLYNNTQASWTPANITAANGATLALNVGGTGEFAVSDVDTLLTSISVANTATSGLQAGSKIGFDTTNATGGIFTQGNAIADSTGANGGAIGVTKLGTNTLEMDKTNTYSGTTTVNNGTLLVKSTGSINSSAGVSVTGGTFRYDGTTALDRNITLNGGKFSYNSVNNYTGALTFTSGTIGGSNISNLDLTIGTGQTMSPGNSTGTMAAGNTTWAAGGTFLFELNDATGTAGSTSAGWDLLNAASLDITAGVGEFTIEIASLDSLQAAGLALNFNDANNYSWLFVDAGATISNFNANKFVFTDSFVNSTAGTFSISQGIGVDDDKLYINYTGVIPEPSTYAMLVGGLGLLAFRRRRKQS